MDISSILTIVFGVIVAILMFTIIVVIHELGHFAAARKFGVKVYEFGIGIPPKVKKLFTDKKGTEYTLNAFPIGGFVRLAGENITSFEIYDDEGNLVPLDELEEKIKNGNPIFDSEGKEIPIGDVKEIKGALDENNAPYSMINKPIWQQLIIISGGVIMNFLLAIFIFSALFFTGVKPILINTVIKTDLDIKLIPTYEDAKEIGLIETKPGLVLIPVSGSISEKGGIKENDVITKVNEIEVNKFEDFSKILSENKSKEILLTKENGEKITLTPSEEGKIGTYIRENIQINEEFEYKYGLIDSIKYGSQETYNQTLLTFKSIGILGQKIFAPKTETERQEAIDGVSGPIGVVSLVSQTIGNGLAFLLILSAVISINLGVFNMLPIPALDGGRFVFISINGLTQKIFKRKAITPQIEGKIHVGFFLILILLSVLIAFNDITKLFS